MKRKRKNSRSSHPPAKRKISEQLWDFAGDFIRLGTSPEQRQSRLTAACSAWNIACNPPQRRQELLDRYIAEYLRYNLRTSPANAAAIRSDIEKLMERKLKRFPADVRQIVGARLVPMGEHDRIEAVSATIGSPGAAR